MKTHLSLQKEQETLKLASAGAEKKLQRKLSELQEVRELDSQAKAHMEESFRLMGEEKDERISVLQTQVSVLLAQVGVLLAQVQAGFPRAFLMGWEGERETNMHRRKICATFEKPHPLLLFSPETGFCGLPSYGGMHNFHSKLGGGAASMDGCPANMSRDPTNTGWCPARHVG